MRTLLTRSATLSFVIVAAGCASETTSCPRVTGQFQPLYTALSGTCGEITSAARVAIDDVAQPVQTNIVTFPNGRLTTMVVRRGCQVEMTQVFEQPTAMRARPSSPMAAPAPIGGAAAPAAQEPWRPESWISGKELSVVSENELSGVVEMTRYDQNQSVACSGTYSARLIKESNALGAAVGGGATR